MLERPPKEFVEAHLAKVLEVCKLSPTQQRFLEYVVEAALKGQMDLSGLSIAVELFDRDPSDPRADNSVKTAKRGVQGHLHRFYSREGHAERVRIVFSEGQYVPEIVDAISQPKPRRENVRPFIATGAIVLFAGVSGYWVWQQHISSPTRIQLLVSGIPKSWLDRGLTTPEIARRLDTKVREILTDLYSSAEVTRAERMGPAGQDPIGYPITNASNAMLQISEKGDWFGKDLVVNQSISLRATSSGTLSIRTSILKRNIELAFHSHELYEEVPEDELLQALAEEILRLARPARSAQLLWCRKGKPKEALSIIEQPHLNEVTPPFDLATAYEIWAEILDVLGNHEVAEAKYWQAIELSPSDARILSDLGGFLRRRGLAPEAEPYLRRAVKLDPKNAIAHVNLGNVLKDQGRLKDALAEYETSTRLTQKAALPEYALGTFLLRFGRYAESIKHFEIAMSRANGKYPQAANNMGIAYADLGASVEAARWFKVSLELDPNDWNVRLNYAHVLIRLDAAQEALQQFEKWGGHGCDPAIPDGRCGAEYMWWGLAFDRLNRWTEAERCFRISTRFAPDDPFGSRLLARVAKHVHTTLEEALKSTSVVADPLPSFGDSN